MSAPLDRESEQLLRAAVICAPKVYEEPGVRARRWLGPVRAIVGEALLLQAAREGLVILHRCDLVQCYPAALVAESELVEPMTGARFHQVSLTR